MQFYLSKDRANKISYNEWDKIQELIAQPTSIMVYDEEVSPSALLRVCILLAIDRVALWRLHVYHDCSDDIIEIREWKDGLGYGEICSNCGNKFNKGDTLFSLEVITLYPIKLK